MPYLPPKILLVEQEPILADVTSFRLELLGYRVQTVAKADEAFAAIDESLPEVIIVDVLLPDVDGFDVVEQITSDQRTTMIPVMVFSTDSSLEFVQRAFAAGAKEFVLTPYDPAVLEEKLEYLLADSDRSV